MSNQSWLDEISSGIEHAPQLYHRLILVTELADAGQTEVGEAVAEYLALSRVNVSLELGERLLSLSIRQRPLQVGRLLKEVVEELAGGVVLLDHLEILFEKSLKQDPLRLLQSLARSRTVVAVWSGVLENGSLTYGDPGHPEHRRYSATDFLVVIARGPGGR